MVIWIVGMSGAGKTTIGRRLWSSLRAANPATVFIDGDEIRSFFQAEDPQQSYTIAARKRNFDRIQGLCSWLDRQGLDVVCCILSVFPDDQRNNRTLFSRYYEVYVKVPRETLFAERDYKGLYAAARSGTMQHVVGVDLPYPEPQDADLTIENTGGLDQMPAHVDAVLAGLRARFADPAPEYPYDKGDRIAERNTYFYTRYQGASFLESWHDARSARRDEMQQRLLSHFLPKPAADDNSADSAIRADGADLTPAQWLARLRGTEPITVGALCGSLVRALNAGSGVSDGALLTWLEKLLKKFEVTKRVYAVCAGERFLAVDKQDYQALTPYLHMAILFEAAYAALRDLRFLNALLKIMDTLSSRSAALDDAQTAVFLALTQREEQHVRALCTEHAIPC